MLDQLERFEIEQLQEETQSKAFETREREGKTCDDCVYFVGCPNLMCKCGWCQAHGFFVFDDDGVEDKQCDQFEERWQR